MATHNPLIFNPSAFFHPVASGYAIQKELRLENQASMFASSKNFKSVRF